MMKSGKKDDASPAASDSSSLWHAYLPLHDRSEPALRLPDGVDGDGTFARTDVGKDAVGGYDGGEELKTMKRTSEWERGVLDAANIADSYNGTTVHAHRLGDCIASKLNVHDTRADTRPKRPRKNACKLQSPTDAWIAGFVVALAETHRRGGVASSSIREAAAAAGITMALAKSVEVDTFDLKELRRAGVK